MNPKNEYYDNLVARVREILENEKYGNLPEGYGVVKTGENYSYSFQDLNTLTPEKQAQNNKNINELIQDFENHLVKGTPFNVVNNGAEGIYEHFFQIYSNFLFDSADHDTNHYVPAIAPTLEEFEKSARCFENILPSVSFIIRGFPFTYVGKDSNINRFIPTILSLHNKHTYANETQQSIKQCISDELHSMTGFFDSEEDPAIREGLSHYLSNKKTFLSEAKDKKFEMEMLYVIKYLVSSDYWREIASQLPNLNVKKKNPNYSDRLFKINTNTIYQIDLDKEGIFSISPAIITDEDFSNMISIINKSINLHKPEFIDFIQIVENGDKLIISGRDVSKKLAHMVGLLFEQMVHEYNSDNIDKKFIQTEDEKNKVQKYLDKAAQVYWLEAQLDKSNINNPSNTKKKKI